LEFRHRSILNLIHFWIAFQLYSVDHTNVVWAFVHWNNPRGDSIARIVFGFAALLLGLAATLRTWAATYLRSEVVHDPALHTEALVADGPYRHVRNPLYLGTFLMSTGLGFLASRSGFVVLDAGAAIRILRLIGREEAELEKQQENVSGNSAGGCQGYFPRCARAFQRLGSDRSGVRRFAAKLSCGVSSSRW